MIKNFYANSLANIILIITIAITGLSLFFDMPIALYPNTSKPRVNVTLYTQNIDALEFKDRFGDEIESKLMGVNDVEKVKSEYSDGWYKWNVEFDWNISLDEGITNIKNAISSYESDFPEKWHKFRYRPDNEQNSNVAVSIYSKKYTRKELYHLLADTLKPKLDTIKGSDFTFITKPDQKFIQISINPDLLIKYGINPGSINESLRRKEYDRSLGSLSFGQRSFTVLANLRDQSTNDLEDTIIGVREKKQIRLKDVATIKVKDLDPWSLYKLNGEKSLIIVAGPKPETNIATFADELLKRVKQNVSDIDPDIKVDIILNPSKFVSEAVTNVGTAIIIGVSIATLTIFLFIGSLRNTIIIAISIPLSLIGGFILMSIMNIEINLISLGAMAIAVGMVVDGSIVVLENIIRLLTDNPTSTRKDIIHRTFLAVKEVWTPIIASLITTIIVFAPLPFTSPLASAILGDLAKVIVCVLTISIFVTLIIVPPLAILFKVKGTSEARKKGIYFISNIFIWMSDKLRDLYIKSLSVILQRKILNIGILSTIGLAFILSFFIAKNHIRQEIMAKPDTDIVILQTSFEGDKELKLNDIENLMAPYEKIILADFESDISHILTMITKGQSKGYILCTLKDKKLLKGFKKKLEERFKDTPLTKFGVYPWLPTALRIPDPPFLRIELTGPNDDKKREELNKIARILQNIKGLNVDFAPGVWKKDKIKIEIDEEKVNKMAAAGYSNISRSTIMGMIQYALEEKYIKDLKIDAEEFEVKMTFSENFISRATDIGNIQIKTYHNNEVIFLPLRNFINIKFDRSWGKYLSENGKDYMRIDLSPKGSYKDQTRELKDKVVSALKKNNKIDFSKLTFSNPSDEITENITSLIKALAIALILIFMVLSIQFGKISNILTIMSAIPLGFIGVSISLFLFSSTLSLNSMLGLILLCGTAVNNSILFIDFYLKRRESSKNIEDALLATAELRFRPIAITTMTTILGMLPIAFGFGSGGEILQPLGIAVCGGLGLSTILTLFVVPLSITLYDKLLFKGKMMPAINTKILLLTASTLLLSTDPIKAYPLDIKTAEDKALDYSHNLNVARKQKIISEYAVKEHYHHLLPKIEVGRTYREEKKRYYNDEVDTTIKQKKGQSWVTIKETIPHPIKWNNDRKIVNNNREIAKNNEAIKRVQVIYDLRNQYFAASLAASHLLNIKEDLKIVEEMSQIANKRYMEGYISKRDLDRTLLLREQNKSRYELASKKHQKEILKLKFLIGETNKESISLTTSIPSTKLISNISQFVDKKDWISNSNKIKNLKLQVENSSLSLANAKADLFPDMELSATYGKKYPDDRQGDLKHEQKTPTLQATLSWELFSGGRDYFKLHQIAQEKGITKDYLKLEKENREESLQAAIIDLEAAIQNLKTQERVVSLNKGILDSSKKQFIIGEITSNVVDDDLREYLSQKDLLIKVQYRIIEKVVDICFLTERKEILYKFVR